MKRRLFNLAAAVSLLLLAAASRGALCPQGLGYRLALRPVNIASRLAPRGPSTAIGTS